MLWLPLLVLSMVRTEIITWWRLVLVLVLERPPIVMVIHWLLPLVLIGIFSVKVATRTQQITKKLFGFANIIMELTLPVAAVMNGGVLMPIISSRFGCLRLFGMIRKNALCQMELRYIYGVTMWLVFNQVLWVVRNRMYRVRKIAMKRILPVTRWGGMWLIKEPVLFQPIMYGIVYGKSLAKMVR